MAPGLPMCGVVSQRTIGRCRQCGSRVEAMWRAISGRRGLTRGRILSPEAPWTGSGWPEYSYGGFGGGRPHFHRCTDDPLLPGRELDGVFTAC